MNYTWVQAFALANLAPIDLGMGGSKNDVQSTIDREILISYSIQEKRLMFAWDSYQAALYLGEGDICVQKATSSQHGDSTTTVFLVPSLKFRDKLRIDRALQFLGDVFLSHDEEDTAVNLFTVALEGFTQMDVHCGKAECMLRLGDIFTTHGDLSKTAELCKTARSLFARS